MNVRRRISELLLLWLLLSGSSFSQVQQEQILGLFDADGTGLMLDESSLRALDTTGVNRSELEAIFQEVRAYQLQHGEGLGVELGLDLDHQATITVSPALQSDEITVSPAALEELRNTYGIKVGSPPNALRESLDSHLGGLGAHDVSVQSFLDLQFEVQQTLEPVDSGVSDLDLSNIAARLCPESGSACEDGDAIFSGGELIDALEQISESAADFAACSKSMNVFRSHFRSRGPQNIREEIDGSADLWQAAARFDHDCLSSPPLDDNAIRNFSVIKLDGQDNPSTSIDPYCGAFRIGPTQFVTAAHCFLASGEMDDDIADRSSLYLISAPNTRIRFKLSRESLDQFELYYPEGVNDDMPAYLDFVVLETEPFDDRSANEFEGIIAKPVIGQETILPGYFVFHSERRTNPGDWTSGIRWTKSTESNYCRAYDISISGIDAGCLVHRCQAIAGYSGSPLLQISEEGRVSIIGVHVIGAENLAHHCPGPFRVGNAARGDESSPLTGSANLAAYLSVDLLIKKGWIKE